MIACPHCNQPIDYQELPLTNEVEEPGRPWQRFPAMIAKDTAQQVVGDICQTFGVDREHLLAGWRDAETVRARRHIAHRLRELGFSYPQIGTVLHRHQESVRYLVRGGA